MQLQFIRSKQRLYTMNDYGQVIKPYECHSDFVPGYNDQDQLRESLPNGNYWCKAELGYFGDPYGTFYIKTHDCRARDILAAAADFPILMLHIKAGSLHLAVCVCKMPTAKKLHCG